MTVSRAVSARVAVWLLVAAAGLFAGALLRRVDLVVLAAPFALAPMVGLAGARSPGLFVHAALDRVRAVEGDEVVVGVVLSARHGAGRVELGAVLPVGFTPVAPRRVAVRLRPGQDRVVELRVTCDRWGTFELGGAVARVRDRSGTATWVVEVGPTEVLRVHPAPETIRTLVRPHVTQLAAGSQVAREKAAGIEHADLRPYLPGDRVRDINWRATARRGEMWVNERHPERTTDVVVFLDSFAEADVERSVRAAVTLASAYLRDRDRVGLVTFGGTLSWIRPGSGQAQQVRMIDHLLGTVVRDSAVWRDLSVVPPGTLPPRSLVVAVSPLDDERAVAALADLRDRSVDLAVVEVVPELLGQASPTLHDDLARRLWQLRREEVRSRLRRSGVAVAEWPEGRAVEAVLAELREVRRRGRLVPR